MKFAHFDAKLPEDIAAKVKGFRKLSKEDHQRWQKILSEQGWYAALAGTGMGCQLDTGPEAHLG